MGQIVCFVAHPVDRAMSSLRRFCWSSKQDKKCPLPLGFHNASIDIGEVDFISEWEGSGLDDLDHADPRWPKKCGCGYEFKDTDVWQHNLDRVYVSDDGKVRAILEELPPGAMILRDKPMWGKLGPDGKELSVMTPGGLWCVDYHPKYPSGWARTGTAPKITANPSIIIGNYHGWLRDGVLVPC